MESMSDRPDLNTDSVRFGGMVRDRRRAEKLSQSELAGQVEISRNYLSQIERGEATNIPPNDLQMLANLKYRGKQPDTLEKWEMLYNVIKLTIGK